MLAQFFATIVRLARKCFVIPYVATISCLTLLGVIVSSAAAEADVCSTTIAFVAPVGTPGTYAIELANLLRTTAPNDFRVTLFSANASYELRLDSQLFSRKVDAAVVPTLSWVSAATYFEMPGGAAVESAYVEPLGADGASTIPCVYNHYLVQSRAETIALPYYKQRTLLAESDAATVHYSKGVQLEHATFRADVSPPDCKQPYAEPKLLRANPPTYPELARRDGVTGMAQVLVELDNTGKPLSAAVAKSANNNDLDSAAELAALTSTYAPQLFRCQAIAGDYVFRAQFER